MGKSLRTSTDVSLVAAQLVGWSLLLFISDMEAVITTPYLLVIVGAGLSLMIASAIQLGRSYSSLTRPRTSGVFVQRGIYRYVRHPIYAGLMIVSLAFLLSRPTLAVSAAYLLIVLVTNVRAGVEERLLEEAYPGYPEYRRSTKRYIPFVI